MRRQRPASGWGRVRGRCVASGRRPRAAAAPEAADGVAAWRTPGHGVRRRARRSRGRRRAGRVRARRSTLAAAPPGRCPGRWVRVRIAGGTGGGVRRVGEPAGGCESCRDRRGHACGSGAGGRAPRGPRPVRSALRAPGRRRGRPRASERLRLTLWAGRRPPRLRAPDPGPRAGAIPGPSAALPADAGSARRGPPMRPWTAAVAGDAAPRPRRQRARFQLAGLADAGFLVPLVRPRCRVRCRRPLVDAADDARRTVTARRRTSFLDPRARAAWRRRDLLAEATSSATRAPRRDGCAGIHALLAHRRGDARRRARRRAAGLDCAPAPRSAARRRRDAAARAGAPSSRATRARP